VAVVSLSALGAGVFGAPAGAAGDEAALEEVWALVESPDGALDVVHGEDAIDAVYDDVLDRSADTVITAETEDAPVSTMATNDPLRGQQWALNTTSFEAAWSTTRGTGVIVAVVDTGVRGDHQDLAPIVLSGADFVNDGGNGKTDPNGHGTHVAGIIAAQANNGVGIAGGAPDVRILPVRVLDANGTGYSSDVAAGIVWAVNKGARVINVSLGSTSPSSGTRDAIKYALSKGALVFAAAGNGAQSGNAPVYPGAFPEAVAVGSIDSNRVRSSFSNYGSYVDLAAPGGNIISTYGSHAASYAAASGTSMATPYASAAAALVIAAQPGNSASTVRAVLEAGADDLGAPGRDDWYGSGLVDPRDSVTRAFPPAPGGGSAGSGYWLVNREGGVRAFGAAPHLGDLAGRPLSAPIVAAAATRTGHGYWLAGADGSVYTFGDAQFHGSMGGTPLNGRIVGMAATPTGGGYILLGDDGGIFSFGDAQFYGSTGGQRLNAPILDLTMTASGRGYWFVGADGGIFSFGDAQFYGSTGGLALNAPVVSMTALRNGAGYWMIGSDGGIFAFNTPFHGSLPWLQSTYGIASVPPAIRVRAVDDGSGYYIMGTDGAVFTFGNARFHGAAPGFNPVDMMLMP
jgi:type VII secretion-associated serine protease mycosin